MPVIAIVQFIFHYLGWLGIILGIIALIVSNTERGIELVVGGVGFLVLKYIIGFVYIAIVSIILKIIEKK